LQAKGNLLARCQQAVTSLSLEIVSEPALGLVGSGFS
jgi:hypothetical protein